MRSHDRGGARDRARRCLEVGRVVGLSVRGGGGLLLVARYEVEPGGGGS